MFQDTLLILKSDYMQKRKPVLLHLLEKGFQIQGSRKLIFSPEQAAEFYQDLSEDKSFMLQVILLAKDTVEAFILTKENAIAELFNTMVCYFTDSVVMESFVHVSKSVDAARFEISYIFPNYLHDPIPFFEKERLCMNKALMRPMIDKLYDIIHNSSDTHDKSWRVTLAEWLKVNNPQLPQVTNQCSYKTSLDHEEKAQQTIIAGTKTDPFDKGARPIGSKSKAKSKAVGGSRRSSRASSHSISMLSTSAGSSKMMSSSSCISCSYFETSEPCKADPCTELTELLRARTQPLTVPESSTSASDVCVCDPECVCPDEKEEATAKTGSSSIIPALEYENTSSEPDMTGVFTKSDLMTTDIKYQEANVLEAEDGDGEVNMYELGVNMDEFAEAEGIEGEVEG